MGCNEVELIELPNEILQKINETKQTHLLEALNKIDTPEKKQDFISQIKSIDFDLMHNLYEQGKNAKLETIYSPSSISKIESQYSKESILPEKDKLSQIGIEYIAQGKIATLILSGGLGTRLGFNHPKGEYNIKLPSNKCLFNYFVNRFIGCQLMCRKKLKDKNIQFKDCPLFIMTSSQNDLDVREFFKKNKNFGVKDENLFFFPQGEICALDNDGKILLENPKKIFRAPDGNGGCLLALKKHGIIDECIKRGIEYINIMAIDNPLYKLMDPLFIGTTISKGKNGKDQMGAKYIKKTDPEQKVGYFLIYKDKPMMLDYMEMPEKLKYAKMDNGDLVYNAANILDYLISVSFLKKAMYEEENIKKLLNSFHHIKKKMNCVVYNNEKNIFEEKNNYEFNKYEMFLNSIFEFSNKDGLLLLEIEEMDEFAPVKNDETKDKCTAATARLQISNLCKKWFKENGGTILNDSPTKYLEISFLVSYDGNDLFDNKDIPKTIDFKDIKEGEGIYIKNKDLE